MTACAAGCVLLTAALLRAEPPAAPPSGPKPEHLYRVQSLVAAPGGGLDLQIAGPGAYRIRRSLTRPVVSLPGWNAYALTFVTRRGPVRFLVKVPSAGPTPNYDREGDFLRQFFRGQEIDPKSAVPPAPEAAASPVLFLPELVLEDRGAGSAWRMRWRDIDLARFQKPDAPSLRDGLMGIGLLNSDGTLRAGEQRVRRALRQTRVLFGDTNFFADLRPSARVQFYRELYESVRQNRALNLGRLCDLSGQSLFNLKIMLANILDVSAGTKTRVAAEYADACLFHYPLITLTGAGNERAVLQMERFLADGIGVFLRLRLRAAALAASAAWFGAPEPDEAGVLRVRLLPDGTVLTDFDGSGQTPSLLSLLSRGGPESPAPDGPALRTVYRATMAAAALLIGEGADEAMASLYRPGTATLDFSSPFFDRFEQAYADLYGNESGGRIRQTARAGGGTPRALARAILESLSCEKTGDPSGRN